MHDLLDNKVARVIIILYVVNTMTRSKEKELWKSRVSMKPNSKTGSDIVYVGIM